MTWTHTAPVQTRAQNRPAGRRVTLQSAEACDSSTVLIA